MLGDEDTMLNQNEGNTYRQNQSNAPQTTNAIQTEINVTEPIIPQNSQNETSWQPLTPLHAIYYSTFLLTIGCIFFLGFLYCCWVKRDRSAEVNTTEHSSRLNLEVPLPETEQPRGETILNEGAESSRNPQRTSVPIIINARATSPSYTEIYERDRKLIALSSFMGRIKNINSAIETNDYSYEKLQLAFGKFPNFDNGGDPIAHLVTVKEILEETNLERLNYEFSNVSRLYNIQELMSNLIRWVKEIDTPSRKEEDKKVIEVAEEIHEVCEALIENHPAQSSYLIKAQASQAISGASPYLLRGI